MMLILLDATMVLDQFPCIRERVILVPKRKLRRNEAAHQQIECCARTLTPMRILLISLDTIIEYIANQML